jgi:Fe2+ transport system protein FeoA
VEEFAPLEGPISIRIGEQVHALGRRIADQIIVERQPVPLEAGA